MATPLALYVHVPFCDTKCPYCDFNTYAGIEALMPGYTGALAHELEQWGAWLEKPTLASLFFGGGTPSFLPTRDMTRLLRVIHEHFDLPAEAEATAEANPGDCARERLQSMRRAGLNRISIGVQSFDDGELRLLGRRHDADQAAEAIRSARVAGFDNLSLDLMFGLPGQFISSWDHTLDEAIALEPDHISAYALTLEQGTPMEAEVRLGRMREPDPDMAAEMYTTAQERLAAAGYQQYEISNWAKPGRESTHNLAYWRSAPYLGVGPGGHSYLHGDAFPQLGAFGARFAETKPPRSYIERAGEWQAHGPITPDALSAASACEDVQVVSRQQAMGEHMMMGLRLNPGVSDATFAERFGQSIVEAFPRATADCLEFGLLEWHDGNLRLTEEARLLGNEAFARFVALPDESGDPP